MTLNGARRARDDLVGRYRALHGAFDAEGRTVATGSRRAAPAGRQWAAGGRGLVEPAGRVFDVLGIDLLGLDEDGLIDTVWVVADELGRLTQVGAFGDPPGT